MFSTFNLQSSGGGVTWSMINALGTAGYEGRLYEKLFAHIAMGGFRNESVATSVGNVWSVVTFDAAGHHTLLVVNANATRSIDLDLNRALWIGPSSAPTTYEWSPGMYNPDDRLHELARGSGRSSSGRWEAWHAGTRPYLYHSRPLYIRVKR
jgi:hypothetical protein